MTIPIVGQAKSRVLQWYPTTIFACQCREDGSTTLLVLTGFGNPVLCQHCGVLYLNDNIREIEPGKLVMDVKAVLPTPEGQVN